jgi:hypothetical protein
MPLRANIRKEGQHEVIMNDEFGPVVAHGRKVGQKRAYILDCMIVVREP